MSTKKSIQVGIKVRPLQGPKEKDQLWRVVENSLQLKDTQTEYYFDHIFDQDATNQIVFDKMAKKIVQSTLEGFNGTIFAYGQTSSGKTYTMMGDEDNAGVMVLTVKEIFKHIDNHADRKFLLRVGYIEIYNEKIYDLLNKKNQDLKIHEANMGYVSVNCEEIVVTSEESMLYYLKKGDKERTVGETSMNERSSRSHAIFRIIIESQKIDPNEDNAIAQSILNLVDLAGSERADQTKASGARLKEGGHINKSLLFLSTVIKRLSENEDDKYISYRDSKLTRILQASLGGNALTAIICTIKPNTIEETQSTLSFATRAKTIKNKPQLNENVSDATMMKRLEKEVEQLKMNLAEERRKNESKIKVGELEQRIKKELLKIISSNSLHSLRNEQEKRRHTWASSLNYSDVQAMPSGIPVPTLMPSAKNVTNSRLQAPKFYTPLITARLNTVPTRNNSASTNASLSTHNEEEEEEEEEEFVPAEMINFSTSAFQSPCSLKPPIDACTPKIYLDPNKALEIAEKNLHELQMFTNLEQSGDVEHKLDIALLEKVNCLTLRIAELERERLSHIQVKIDYEELLESNNQLKQEFENRCADFQMKINQLVETHETAAQQYEAQLAELRKTSCQLEMENRNFVNLDVKYELLQNKFKLREEELLQLLSDKEQEIAKLEKSVKFLSKEQLKTDKDKLKQIAYEDKAKELDAIYINNGDWGHLLEENRKVTAELAKLKLECDRSRVAREAEQVPKEGERLEENSRDKLHKDQQTAEKLSDTNWREKAAWVENKLKMLQDKYDNLENNWQEQHKTLENIQCQYKAIQAKYQKLQIDYEQLEVTSGESLSRCERMQQENDALQEEINQLKANVEEAQRQWRENTETIKLTNVVSKGEESDNSETWQTQFEELQKEYDDLSNQLMDSLQESETLKRENLKLRELVSVLEASNACSSEAHTQVHLKSENASHSSSHFTVCNNTSNSNRSSGLGAELEQEEKQASSLLKQFQHLAKSLNEIELILEGEHNNTTTHIYKMFQNSILTQRGLAKCKILINAETQIQSQSCRSESTENESESSILLQGILKQSPFQIITLELPDDRNSSDMEIDDADNRLIFRRCDNEKSVVQRLKYEIVQLEKQLQEEKSAYKLLLDNTERNIAEMKEQINRLTMELLEKSMVVENCTCDSYQKEIAQKAETTTTNETTLGQDGKDSKPSESFYLREHELQGTIDNQNHMIENLTHRLLELEAQLKTSLEQREKVESEYRNLQREKRQMLDAGENFKETLQEWENGRARYESIIAELKETHQDKHLELQSEIKKLTEREGTLAKQYKQLQDDFEISKEHVRRLTDERNTLHKLVEASEIKCRSLTKEIEHLNDLEGKHKSLITEKLKLAEELEQVEMKFNAKHSKQSEIVKTLELNIQALKNECDELKMHRSQLETKLQGAETQIEELCIEDASRETVIQKLESKVQDLQSSIQGEYEKTQMLQKEIQILTANKEKSEESKRWEEQCKKLEVNAKENEERVNELQRAVDVIKLEKETIQNDLNKLHKARNEELKNLQNSYEAQKSTLTQELKALNEALSSSQATEQAVQVALASLKAENHELKDTLRKEEQQWDERYKKWETVVEEKESIVNELKHVNETFKAQNKKMQNDMEKLDEARNEEMNKLRKSWDIEKSAFTSELEEIHQTLSNLKTAEKTAQTDLASLKVENDQLRKTLEQREVEKNLLEDHLQSLKHKLEDVQQTVHEMRCKANAYEKLLDDHKEVKTTLAVAQQLIETLQKEIITLKDNLAAAKNRKSTVNALTKEVQTLESDLRYYRGCEDDYKVKLKQMEDEIQEKTLSFNKQQIELKTTVQELNLKCNALETSNLKLQQNDKAMQNKFEELNKHYDKLKKKLEDSTKEVHRNKQLLDKEVESTQALRTELKIKEAQYASDMQTLQAEKQNQEAKNHTKSLEANVQYSKTNGRNASVESNTSTTISPRQRFDICERKTRRLSVHDERRSQSFWISSCDKETMTMPLDSKCQCEELDKKLRECKDQLFIRDNQVTWLQLEIKNHPLQLENADLLKRLDEERTACARLKEAFKEQRVKTQRALNSYAKIQAQLNTQESSASSSTSRKPSVANAEVQTDADLNDVKMKLKYMDIKNICRIRYNRILKLEEQLKEQEAQKENSEGNTNTLPAQEAGQVRALKAANNMMAAELQMIKGKYEHLQKALERHHDEVAHLRTQLEKDTPLT